MEQISDRHRIETDPLVVQSGHLDRDFLARLTVIATIAGLMWSSPVFIDLVAALAVYCLGEICQFTVARRLARRATRPLQVVLVVNALVGSAAISYCALVLHWTGQIAYQFMAIAATATAILHCVLIRSRQLAICLATLAPLAWAMGVMLLPLIAAAGREGDALPVIACCVVVLGYTLHAVWSQSWAYRSLLGALDAAQAANRARSRFLTSMSHEIRTPLNGILGIAQINARMADRAGDDEARELAATLLASGAILKSMVDDVLDQARIEAGRMELHPAPMSLEGTCHSVVRLFTPNAQEKGLDLRLEIAEEVPPWIVADGLRLYQIMANLVSNAVKFTHVGEVRLIVEVARFRDPQIAEGRPQVDLRITVRDTGPGLTAAEAGILFDPFTQVGSEADLAAKGTGLGLPISRDLARLMGGDIVVASVPGAGTSFTVLCPALPIAAAAALPERPNAAAGDADLAGMRLLLVDDNRTNRMIVRTFLRGTGIGIVEAENGADGLKAARDGRFDLVLMDMRMPVMDGATAFRHLRAAGNAVPVIALTANAMAEDRATYLAMGMDGYLSKPLDRDDLVREVARFARLPAIVAAE